MRRTNQKGVRWIDGREFLLCGREKSSEGAQSAANTLREDWTLVRVIKLWEYDYMLYVHGRK